MNPVLFALGFAIAALCGQMSAHFFRGQYYMEFFVALGVGLVLVWIIDHFAIES
jgi:hypothetical protein